MRENGQCCTKYRESIEVAENAACQESGCHNGAGSVGYKRKQQYEAGANRQICRSPRTVHVSPNNLS